MKSIRTFGLVLGLLLAGGTARFDLSFASLAQAQEGADESRATTFQAVEGAQKESVPGGPLLITAYGFVLVALLAYVARLGLMQRRTSADVDRLTALLEQKRKA